MFSYFSLASLPPPAAERSGQAPMTERGKLYQLRKKKPPEMLTGESFGHAAGQDAGRGEKRRHFMPEVSWTTQDGKSRLLKP